jgi:hypothetical protein
MRVRTGMVGLLIFACAGSVAAQTTIDRSFSTTSKDCSGVQWSKEAVARYPTIASACQSVEERGGKSYVKFQGTVQRNIDRGKELVVAFKDGGNVTLTPPPETNVYIDNKQKSVRDLERGDELNFYIAEDRFAAQFAQDETPTPRYAAVPIIYRETTSTYEQTAAALPETASNSGLWVICGAMLMAFGMMLSIRRRNRGR